MRTKLLLVSFALIGLAACTSAPPVSEIPANIINATTPADHQRIADYFAQKASGYDSEARLHDKMAQAYSTRPKGDLPAMVSHCRALREQLTNAAKEARELEQAHRQLAGSLGKQ